jgi:signal transduction histidine kinase
MSDIKFQQNNPQSKTLNQNQANPGNKKVSVNGRGVDFITILAHQMRTPLTAVKWYTDLLLSGKAGDLKHEQRDYLLDIYQSNERMIRLVDNLLIIEQLEGNVLPIVTRSTSIAGVIKSVVEEYQTFAKVNNIALIYHCDGANMPAVKIDPIYMRLAIKNIIDNALSYTPKRGTVVISCEEKKNDNKKSMILKISDTGIGIPIEEQEKIFHKFYRSSESMAMQTEGTGLGLFIAKVVIERNNGKIWFNSRENALDKTSFVPSGQHSTLAGESATPGTTFYIELPVAS